MMYQLVLQFPAESVDEFDELVAIEGLLIKTLTPDSEVDGHDFGAGEFNIFVLTDRPEEAFRSVKMILESKRSLQGLRAAYRELGQSSFVMLWPSTRREFRLA